MGTHWLNVEIALQGSNGPSIATLLAPREGAKDGNPRKDAGGKVETKGDDLPYRVELWNAEKTAVEQVLAVTASPSIGQAAFYAAAREYADRYVTLRHKQAVINRWNGPSH